MDINTFEKILEILAEITTDKECEIKLTWLERVVVTERILRLPVRMTERQREAIGKKIIRKIWGEDFHGDLDKVKW